MHRCRGQTTCDISPSAFGCLACARPGMLSVPACQGLERAVIKQHTWSVLSLQPLCCAPDAVDSGPEHNWRRARNFLPHDAELSSIFNGTSSCIELPQMRVTAAPQFLQYLEWLLLLDDRDFLESFSTSPLHEEPSFVKGMTCWKAARRFGGIVLILKCTFTVRSAPKAQLRCPPFSRK